MAVVQSCYVRSDIGGAYAFAPSKSASGGTVATFGSGSVFLGGFIACAYGWTVNRDGSMAPASVCGHSNGTAPISVGSSG